MHTENHSSDAYCIYKFPKSMNNMMNTTYPFHKCAQNVGLDGKKKNSNNSVQKISI